MTLRVYLEVKVKVKERYVREKKQEDDGYRSRVFEIVTRPWLPVHTRFGGCKSQRHDSQLKWKNDCGLKVNSYDEGMSRESTTEKKGIRINMDLHTFPRENINTNKSL